MRIGIEIPIHEAIVFDFGSANINGFLEEYPPRILLVGQQFVESLPVPFGFTRGRGNTQPLQSSGDFAEATPMSYLPT